MPGRYPLITEEHRAALKQQVLDRIANLTPEERAGYLARRQDANRSALAEVALKAVRDVVEGRPAD